MLIYFLVSFVVALISVFLIRRYFRRHALNYSSDAVQRFHHGATPRLGGMGIFIGWMLGLFVAFFLDSRYAGNTAVLSTTAVITIVVFLVVLVGTAEDYTQKVTPKLRLLLTGIAAIAAIYWLGLSVPRLDLVILDQYWVKWPLLGILLAFIGLVGLTHAFNLIDGYNGLAGTVAVLIALAYAYVSFKVGDRELLIMSVCVIAATLGFLFLNYPRGLIFAGDGGAYFWGFLLALIGILLVQRHPQVSAWFPVLLLIYPIWETAFSTYRKLARGQSPGMADALHLHQLVYHRVVRTVFHEDEAKMLLSRNNRTTPYLIVFTTFAIVPATLFWNKTGILILATVLFAVSYCLAYVLIVRFKVPRWLQR